MRVPSYRKHSTRDRAFVEVAGKRHYLPGAHNSPESRDAYAKAIERFVRGGFAAPAEAEIATATIEREPGLLSLCGLVALWLDHVKLAGTQGEYYHGRAIARLIVDKYPDLAAKDFGPLRLMDLREAMLEAVSDVRDEQGKLIERGKRKWSRKYINDQVQRLRRVFRWGISRELIQADQLAALESVTGLRKGRTTAAEPRAVLPAPLRSVAAVLRIAPPTVAAMIRTQWRTGMRSHHLCSLRVVDIDMTRDVWVYTPRRHEKGNAKKLKITIGPKTQAVLAPLLDRPEESFLFSPREAMIQRGRSPRQEVADKYNSTSYRRALVYLIEQAECAHFHPHQLRHSAGTKARRVGGLEAAQAVLGHDRIDVTQIYAEKHLEIALEMARRIG